MTKIYFHCGGFWAMCHYIGAIEQLYKEYNKPNSRLDRNIKFYGNSAGSAWALVCYLVLNGIIEVEQMKIKINKQFDKNRPLSHILTPIYCDLIDCIIPYMPPNLHSLVSGVLHIGVTTKDGFRATQFLFAGYLANKNNYTTHLSFWK
jgi:hypothetical protein